MCVLVAAAMWTIQPHKATFESVKGSPGPGEPDTASAYTGHVPQIYIVGYLSHEIHFCILRLVYLHANEHDVACY